MIIPFMIEKFFRDEAYSILDGMREYYLKGLKRFRDMNN